MDKDGQRVLLLIGFEVGGGNEEFSHTKARLDTRGGLRRGVCRASRGYALDSGFRVTSIDELENLIASGGTD
jgi:hypothetical protein